MGVARSDSQLGTTSGVAVVEPPGLCPSRSGPGALGGRLCPRPRGQRAHRGRVHRLRADRQASRSRLPRRTRRRCRGCRRGPPGAARRGDRLDRRRGSGIRRFPPFARRPRRGCRRRLDARSLARLDDHDGLRRGQGRLRREAAEPVRARGPVDGRRGPAARPGRPGRDSAALGPALSAGAGADPAGHIGRSARSG